MYTRQGYPGYLRELHWKSIGLSEIPRVVWQLYGCLNTQREDMQCMRGRMTIHISRHGIILEGRLDEYLQGTALNLYQNLTDSVSDNYHLHVPE